MVFGRFMRKCSSDGKRDLLENKLVVLESVSISEARSVAGLNEQSFAGWLDLLMRTESPVAMRSVLYYGFQPLFDSLADGALQSADEEVQAVAYQILDAVLEASGDFLQGFYTGQPDVEAAQARLSAVADSFDTINEFPFWTKQRNLDMHYLSAESIHRFMRHFVRAAIDGTIRTPDYVVGAACGASEVAIALGAAIETDVGVMRYSKRRYDEHPIVLPGHEEAFLEGVNGKVVSCVEDFVCTGGSLKKIVDDVRSRGGRDVYGVSVRKNNMYTCVLELDAGAEDFKVFK